MSAVPAWPPGEETAVAWSPWRRFGFRLAFSYLVLYCVPFPIGLLPGTGPLSTAYDGLWQGLAVWVGRVVLRLDKPITVFTNGSGDTTYNYVQVLCYAVLALLIAALWTALDRRPRHDRLREALRVYLRWDLAWTMLGYGLSKVFVLQFQAPPPGRLMQPYGESSPMGLLWTFMGSSAPYTIFSGAAEVLGGGLLLFRRTTLLGALVCSAVMANVVMLNLCYDVPVKLYSMHLLAMAVYLLLPDLRRLGDLLLFDRPTRPAPAAAPWVPPRLARVMTVCKWALILTLGFAQLSEEVERAREVGQGALQIPMAGAFEVEEFRRGEQAVVPPAWKRLTISKWGFSVTLADASRLGFRHHHDAARKTLALEPWPGQPGSATTLSYGFPSEGMATLEGTYEGAPIRLRLRRVDTSKSLLVTRGFHWINEYPFNR